MRNLIYLIILGVAGFVAYNTYQGRSISEIVTTNPLTSFSPPTEAPVEAPVFRSRIPLPEAADANGKFLAPPGIFYVLERVSVRRKTGVHAIIPGDEVKLLKRFDDGSLRLTDGEVEFVVTAEQATNDLERARTAEMLEQSLPHGKL